jgi:hypothetical protein
MRPQFELGDVATSHETKPHNLIYNKFGVQDGAAQPILLEPIRWP